MKKQNTKIRTSSALLVLGIIAILGVGLVAAFPFSGFSDNKQLDWHKSIKDAIKNGDYDSWRSHMEERLSEENFNKIVEWHKGISDKFTVKHEEMQAIQEALEAEDYDAWYALVTSNGKTSSITEKITKDNFATFVKLHEAKKNGDIETARELANELGFEWKHSKYYKQYNFKHWRTRHTDMTKRIAIE